MTHRRGQQFGNLNLPNLSLQDCLSSQRQLEQSCFRPVFFKSASLNHKCFQYSITSGAVGLFLGIHSPSLDYWKNPQFSVDLRIIPWVGKGSKFVSCCPSCTWCVCGGGGNQFIIRVIQAGDSWEFAVDGESLFFLLLSVPHLTLSLLPPPPVCSIFPFPSSLPWLCFSSVFLLYFFPFHLTSPLPPASTVSLFPQSPLEHMALTLDIFPLQYTSTKTLLAV